jgi:hypothetical protein
MPEKYQNMSQIPSVDGQSPRGLINTEEAMKSLNRGVVVGGLTLALASAGVEILASFDTWYIGPWKEAIAGGVAIAVMYLRIKVSQKKMLEMGKELDDSAR